MMELKHTHWRSKEVRESIEFGNINKFILDLKKDSEPYQPEFGILIAWNEPKKLWKPWIAITCWHWSLRIGFLFDWDKELFRDIEEPNKK